MTAQPLRPIETDSFAKVARDPSTFGPVPMLQWVKIADLVVDETYQRPISGAGRTNVRRIAEGFRWSSFAPIVVSPVPGGRYAIIDGQHRTTAAALLGFDSVPAQVVIVETVEAARAFKEINGNVTRMTAQSLHAAAVASGDPEAIRVRDIAAAADVTILAHPRAVEQLKPGETLAIGAIRAGLRNHGADTVITALQCVTETSNNLPGALSGLAINALCLCLGANPTFRDAGERLLAAFDAIDLETETDEAKVTRRTKGVSTQEVLADRLSAALRAHFKGVAA